MAEFRKRRGLSVLFVLLVAGSAPALASRRVTDELGRTVVVPDEPHRILCLTPSLTETVYELGAGDFVVGVTDYTEFPAQARAKPSVGGLVDPSMEKIVALRPDLVLVVTRLNRTETIQQLEDLSLPVFVVDPQGLDGILKMVQSVGDAINRPVEALDLVKRLTEKRDAVATRVKGLPQPKILVVIWYEPVVTVGSKAFITDAISAAGGESVTADIPQAWPQISMEEVIRRAPDFLLLIKELHGGISLDVLKAHAGWDRLDAVRDARVIYVDERLELPSPSVFDALEGLARAVHPSAFAAK
jgi:ABC-type Fe3+-hydroxamate transport system substrate-binding protein